MPGWRDFPILFRHSVVAIYKKVGGGPEGVIKAMLISRDTLAKQGYLNHRGNRQVLDGIVLTGKGFARNAVHLREGMAGSAKDLEFERLFKMIEPKLYELDGPGGKNAPKGAKDATERGQDERTGIKTDGKVIPGTDTIPRKK